MTQRYSDMNQHDALYKTARAYPGGVEALAQRLGINKTVMYSKLRPGVDTHHVTFEQLSEILECLVEARVPDALQSLHALNWRHGLVAFDVPQPSERDDDCLIQYVCKSVQEFGHVTSAVIDALADGNICKDELERIEMEFTHVFSALGELRERVMTKAKSKVSK